MNIDSLYVKHLEYRCEILEQTNNMLLQTNQELTAEYHELCIVHAALMILSAIVTIGLIVAVFYFKNRETWKNE